MTGLVEKQIEIGNYLVNKGLVDSFFHSVELLEADNQIKYPVYRRGTELVYVGVDDTQERFGYSRLNGTPTFSVFSPGSCSKGYEVTAPYRLVIFNHKEELQRDYLIEKLLGIGFLPFVTVVNIDSNTNDLAQTESPIIQFEYDGKTFYLAIDVTLKILLSQNECENFICNDTVNPICK